MHANPAGCLSLAPSVKTQEGRDTQSARGAVSDSEALCWLDTTRGGVATHTIHTVAWKGLFRWQAHHRAQDVLDDPRVARCPAGPTCLRCLRACVLAHSSGPFASLRVQKQSVHVRSGRRWHSEQLNALDIFFYSTTKRLCSWCGRPEVVASQHRRSIIRCGVAPAAKRISNPGDRTL